MKKTKKSSVILFFVLVAILISLTGCGPPLFKPNISLNLDKTAIIVNSGKVSQDFITATVVRLDEVQTGTIFTLKLQSDKQNAYFTDVDGNKITELTTDSLKGKESIATKQFKIYGSKGEANQAKYILTVQLWWNGTIVNDQTKSIEVTID